MVRRERADAPPRADGVIQVENAVGRRDLLGVGHAVLALRDSNRGDSITWSRSRAASSADAREHLTGVEVADLEALDERRSARHRALRPSRESSRRSRRLLRGSPVRPARHRASAGAATDGRSATAIARASAAGCRARTRRRRRGRPAPGSSGFCGLVHRDPELVGDQLRGRSRELSAAATRASGRVSSHSTSCFSASRSRTSAPIGAVAATPILTAARRAAAASRAPLCGARRRCGR